MPSPMPSGWRSYPPLRSVRNERVFVGITSEGKFAEANIGMDSHGDNSVVYLVHADRPYQRGRSKPIQHYIGTADNLDTRIEEHRKTTWTRLDEIDWSGGKPHSGKVTGSGALILGLFNGLGITWHVVRTWPGGRKLERHLKRQKHAWRHCPECRAVRKRTDGKRKSRKH